MGAEGSVTLQLREAVEAPDSSGQSDTTSLTIGYPETDLLADIHGSIQATGKLWPHAMLRTFSYHIITRNNKSFYQYWEGKKRRKELCIIYSFLTHSSLLLLRYVFVSLCGFYVRVNINLCALVCVCVRVRVVLYGALVAFMYFVHMQNEELANILKSQNFCKSHTNSSVWEKKRVYEMFRCALTINVFGMQIIWRVI